MEESQKATALVAPPEMEAVESGKQTKLPFASVVNLPLLDKLEQLYEEILTLPLAVSDPPIPTLPVKLARPETFRPLLNTPMSVTDNDCPTPTLPVTTNDPPTPMLPKNPVPTTWKLKVGKVVPTPTLPLSKTDNPWVSDVPE